LAAREGKNAEKGTKKMDGVEFVQRVSHKFLPSRCNKLLKPEKMGIGAVWFLHVGL
jgi:hypothetical protein